jgi:hypothetical protein
MDPEEYPDREDPESQEYSRRRFAGGLATFAVTARVGWRKLEELLRSPEDISDGRRCLESGGFEVQPDYSDKYEVGEVYGSRTVPLRKKMDIEEYCRD